MFFRGFFLPAPVKQMNLYVNIGGRYDSLTIEDMMIDFCVEVKDANLQVFLFYFCWFLPLQMMILCGCDFYENFDNKKNLFFFFIIRIRARIEDWFIKGSIWKWHYQRVCLSSCLCVSDSKCMNVIVVFERYNFWNVIVYVGDFLVYVDVVYTNEGHQKYFEWNKLQTYVYS